MVAISAILLKLPMLEEVKVTMTLVTGARTNVEGTY